MTQISSRAQGTVIARFPTMPGEHSREDSILIRTREGRYAVKITKRETLPTTREHALELYDLCSDTPVSFREAFPLDEEGEIPDTPHA